MYIAHSWNKLCESHDFLSCQALLAIVVRVIIDKILKKSNITVFTSTGGRSDLTHSLQFLDIESM